MATLMKHSGKVGEKPCIVVFREVPGDIEYCLVVETGSLDDSQHQALMQAVQSPEGQQANELSQVLARRTFPDGSNMFNSLHFSGKLLKKPVSQVNLVPLPHSSIPLSEVNKEIRRAEQGHVAPINNEAHLMNESTKSVKPIVPPTAANAVANGEDAEGVAKMMLLQADLIEADAMRDALAKREEAYALVPSLRPAAKKAVAKTTLRKAGTVKKTAKTTVKKDDASSLE